MQKSIIVFSMILCFCGASLAGIALKLGLSWAPAITVEDTANDLPMVIESGTLYDELSPELSFLWNIGVFSIGLRVSYLWAQDIFGQNQPTVMTAWLFGGEAIYNYEMTEDGRWLFPMIISGGYGNAKISFQPEPNRYDIVGHAWELVFTFGVERVWKDRYSFGFMLGRQFSRAYFEDDFLGIEPKVNGDGWKFAFIGRWRI